MPTFIAATLLTSASAAGQSVAKREPLIIQDQGSFAVGGTVTTAPGAFDPLKPLEPAGQSFRGDHVYAFYQVPVSPRKYPVVMWHGAGQPSKTWETTSDGREGFQNNFLRRIIAGFDHKSMTLVRRMNARVGVRCSIGCPCQSTRQFGPWVRLPRARSTTPTFEAAL